MNLGGHTAQCLIKKYKIKINSILYFDYIYLPINENVNTKNTNSKKNNVLIVVLEYLYPPNIRTNVTTAKNIKILPKIYINIIIDINKYKK